MKRYVFVLGLLPVLLTARGAHAESPSDASSTPARAVFGSCPQKPVWPEAAQREQRSGNVSLAFLVDADDTLLESKVRGSSGHADLDEAAREGISKCKFKAATVAGKPVRAWMDLRYNWVPQKAAPAELPN